MKRNKNENALNLIEQMRSRKQTDTMVGDLHDSVECTVLDTHDLIDVAMAVGRKFPKFELKKVKEMIEFELELGLRG